LEDGDVANGTSIVCLSGSEDTGGITRCKAGAEDKECKESETKCLQVSPAEAEDPVQDPEEATTPAPAPAPADSPAADSTTPAPAAAATDATEFIAGAFPTAFIANFSYLLFAFGITLMAGMGVVMLMRRQQASADEDEEDEEDGAPEAEGFE